MIPRYSRPEMVEIWSDENKYKIWFEIELLSCEAMEKLGIVPLGTSEKIRKNASWSVKRTLEIEQITKHDVIAFLTNISETAGDDAKYLHLGMTSSDILDTRISIQIKQSTEILLQGINKVLEILKKRAFEHKFTPCIGRSHGIHAEPITIGLKFASFYAEMNRCKTRLINSANETCVCKISGAVGTFANIDPFVQNYVANKLKISEDEISTQVISRDRIANFACTLAVIASTIERISIEIRHSQRTEVLEMEEGFTKGQKGSSAMPHKKNPILSENLTGLSRLIRSYSIPALENVALWHERDISHSSVERMALPDSCILLDFALNRLFGLIENLTIYPENALRNLNKLKGLVFSQRVLLTLIDEAGISREEAYLIVQPAAMKIWDNSSDEDFCQILLKTPAVVAKLSQDKIRNIFDMGYHLKNVDYIFSKVFVG